MTARWMACVVVGLAAGAGYAQTQPVAAQEYQEYQNDQGDQSGQDSDEVDAPPLAPSAPPALPTERITARPFAGAVWTNGHWFWDGSQWRYKPGAWIASMAGYQFVNGYWRQEPDGWRWMTSGWARAGSTDVEFPIDVVNEEVSTAQAPPPVQVESQPMAPAANLTWAPGYWYWSGSNYVWVEGSWVSPPRAGLVFVSPRWVHGGAGWVFVGGGWAAPGSVHVTVPVYRHAGISVSWGHPNYFLYSWHRYPMVHRYYGYRSYGGRPAYDRPQRYYSAPQRDYVRPQRAYSPPPRDYGRPQRDYGRQERNEGSRGNNTHSASPAGEHGGGNGGGHRRH